MLEQLQKAYQAALGNVVFVDFKNKKIVKGDADVQKSKA